MNTTAKATLIKKADIKKVRSVALVQEKLARSRLILQLEQRQRKLLEEVNCVLNPIINKGHHGLSHVELSVDNPTVVPNLKYAWFALVYRRTPLMWWRMDKSTLDQLASSYYGSQSSALQSPLRAPSQSEFRLVKKLLLAAIDTLAITELDKESLELELVTNTSPLEAPLAWHMHFPAEHFGHPMMLCMTDSVLGLMAQAPSEYQAEPNLREKLQHRLKQIPIKATVQLGCQMLPVSSLDALNIGEIIPMNLHARCPIKVGRSPLFYASVHHHEGQLVAKINQEKLQSEELQHV